MFDILEGINARPRPFEFYTARELWANQHTSERMLAFHLDEKIDVSSRRLGFINRSVLVPSAGDLYLEPRSDTIILLDYRLLR